MAISISPRRRHVVISRSPSGDALALDGEQGLRDLGLGHAVEPQHPLLEHPRAVEHRPQRVLRDGVLPHRPQLAGRAGEHEHRRPVAVRGRHHQAGRRADRLEDRRALGDDRLLAVAGPHRLLAVGAPARAVAAQDGQDPLLQRLVEHHRPPREGADDVGREVVRRRAEPAAGDDQVAAAEEVERRPHVGRPVADDDDLRHLDPALPQPLGQPRAVAVGDGPRQHLRAGDDDAGADAHPQVGRSDSGSSRGRLPGRMS